MKKYLLSVVSLIVLGLCSCETDIDVNAEYQDIPVVYGIINPADTVHYIRITKAFLGETSALNLAADANNFNYAADELTVVVEGWNGSSTVGAPYVLTRTVNEVPKDSGTFDNSTNVLYKFVEANIDRSRAYRITITNATLDKEITGVTEIVGDITVSNPPNTNGKFQFWNGTVATGLPLIKTIKINSGADIGRVEARLIFNYYDIYTMASGKDSVLRRISMRLGEEQTTTSLGSEDMEWTLKGETFFTNITAVPDITSDISHRRLDNISLEFAVAGSELSTYMSVSAPSNTLNQDKPNYTNLTNGVGIFSSREHVLWTSSINIAASSQVNIQNSTITYLATHSSLVNKGFCFGYPSGPTHNFVAPCTRQ